MPKTQTQSGWTILPATVGGGGKRETYYIIIPKNKTPERCTTRELVYKTQNQAEFVHQGPAMHPHPIACV